jgi:hypothetical protein
MRPAAIDEPQHGFASGIQPSIMPLTNALCTSRLPRADKSLRSGKLDDVELFAVVERASHSHQPIPRIHQRGCLADAFVTVTLLP